MRGSSISKRLCAAAALAFALAACNATDYAKPISTFADATTAADAALTDLSTAATDKFAQQLLQRARTDPGIVVTQSQGDCDVRSAHCRIVLMDPNAPTQAQVYPPPQVIGDLLLVMGEIRDYAQNLAAIVADDSAAQAQASVTATLGSVQTLANTVAALDKKGTTTVPAFATPVGSAVNWVLGEYVNQVKLNALRTATREADPVMQRAVGLFEGAAFFGFELQRRELSSIATKRIDDYSRDRGNATKLEAAVAAAHAYNELLTANPTDTFKKMGAAHAALTDALQHPDLSLPQAIAAIQSFAKDAQTLAMVAKNLNALNAKK